MRAGPVGLLVLLVSPPLALLCACGAGPLGSSGPGQKDIDQSFPQDPNNKVDLLFVVDNSPGMAAKQQALVRAFPSLLGALGSARGGLPDLRVGVVSSDLGAPGSHLASCDHGDRGLLQVAPRGDGATCNTPVGATFAVSLDNGTRNNFMGQLADVFGCIAPLGVTGCGFEHHLAAARRALDVDQPVENEGFLRPDAFLGLIVLADEDDCSAPPNTDMFEPATTRYGPQTSFRCNELGHLCGGKPPPRAPGAPLGACVPAEDDGKLVPVADYVHYFESLKDDPGRVLAQVLAGPPEPYQVRAGADGTAEIAPSCDGNGGAAPAVRLKRFADGFGARGSFASICDADLGPTLERFGQAIAQQIGSACLSARPSRFQAPGIPPAQLPPDCRVYERAVPFARPKTVPRCHGSSARPCWRLVSSPQRCEQSTWELKIDRDTPSPPGTVATMHCRVCTDPKDPRCP